MSDVSKISRVSSASRELGRHWEFLTSSEVGRASFAANGKVSALRPENREERLSSANFAHTYTHYIHRYTSRSFGLILDEYWKFLGIT